MKTSTLLCTVLASSLGLLAAACDDPPEASPDAAAVTDGGKKDGGTDASASDAAGKDGAPARDGGTDAAAKPDGAGDAPATDDAQPDAAPPVDASGVSPALQAAADQAFEYGYPLTETMRVCDELPEANKLSSKTALSTSDDKTFVLPNNDTLYTSACIYLGAGWVRLTIPPPPESRYMSADIFDAYTNTAVLVSARDVSLTYGKSIILHLAGTPTTGIPDGVAVYDVQTPYAYALIRTLVSSPADLADANDAQAAITLVPSATTPAPGKAAIPASSSTAQDFFLKLMVRLAQNPPPASEAALVAGFAAAGITPSLTPSLASVTAEQLATWETAYTTGFQKVASTMGALASLRGAWAFPSPKVADPGTDYALRAGVARYGIFPLRPTESIYPRTSGDGSTPQVLHLPATWAPIDERGFWSLTMYASGFLVANPINRYSIGNRTPGVQKEEDGSLKIYVQCQDPGGALTANWLPAPCGAYSMTMRLYLPTEVAQDPAFTIPPLE